MLISTATPHFLLLRWFYVLRCPTCGGAFHGAHHHPALALQCQDCNASYEVQDGIPRLLMPERRAEVGEFCARYDALRLQEGWASTVPGYYENLPTTDVTGRHRQEWQLRARSVRYLKAWLARTFPRQRVRILDAGAGSGWLSRLLAAQHEVLALDLNAGPHGLAALPASLRSFLAVQAELEHLPLASRSFDVVIANASLHYARAPQAFFTRAQRVLRPGGRLLVMDSPVYPSAAAADAARARSLAYYRAAGFPELAGHYGGLTEESFTGATTFSFRLLRRDFRTVDLLKKWLRERTGQPAAARFPLWIGTRLSPPGEQWRLGRARAGAVLVHQGHLLTYRSLSENVVHWRIPGGGIEAGETPEQAVRRELQEEIGVDIELRHQFGPYLHARKSEWYFLAHVRSGSLPREHDPTCEDNATVQWLPLAQLPSYDLRPVTLKWELQDYLRE